MGEAQVKVSSVCVGSSSLTGRRRGVLSGLFRAHDRLETSPSRLKEIGLKQRLEMIGQAAVAVHFLLAFTGKVAQLFKG